MTFKSGTIKNLQNLAFRNNAIFLSNKEKIDISIEDKAYYNAYLLNTFGIYLTNPDKISPNVISTLNRFLPKNVPQSFYNNPQDTKYFSCHELFLEQVISYIIIELSGTNNPDTNFNRVELFNKLLPDYIPGGDVHIRYFTVVDKDNAENFFSAIAENYSHYTRPWGVRDTLDIISLYKNNLFDISNIKCKDNIITLMSNVTKNDMKILATMLDAKDVVKYSKNKYGEKKKLKVREPWGRDILSDELLSTMLNNCKLIPEVSKKQAKGFNALCKLFKINRKVTNENNPERLAWQLLYSGDVRGCADLLSKHGSLLTRHLLYLLSRACWADYEYILNLLPDKSPIALIQLAQKIAEEKEPDKPRTFTFIRNNKLLTHTETEEEFDKRGTIIDYDSLNLILNHIRTKIISQFTSKPKIGSAYINPEFKNVAVPINTAANGVGLDVLSTGSRIKLNGDYVRAFCYWKDVFDIDASCILADDNGRLETFYWGNYHAKKYGDNLLCSGDARGKNGAEYIDLKIDGLRKQGVKYAIYVINGYGGILNQGAIFCGYQDKGKLLKQFTKEQLDGNNVEDTKKLPTINDEVLNSKCWDPKNIEFQIEIKGDSRSFIAFAIDLEKKEIIVLNLVLDKSSRVVDVNNIKTITKYLKESYLEVNMFDLLSCRASTIVDNPEEADYVFDSNYINKTDKEQIIVRPGNTPLLISLL